MTSLFLFQSAYEKTSGDRKHYIQSFVQFFRDRSMIIGMARGLGVRAVDIDQQISLSIFRTPTYFGFFSLLLSPFLFAEYFFLILFLRVWRGTKYIVCLSVADKIFATPLARIFGMKIYWPETDAFAALPIHPSLHFLARFSARFSTILTCSEAARQHLTTHFPIDRITVFPHPVALSPSQPSSSFDPTKSFVLSFMGPLTKSAGIDIALRAIADVKTVMPHIRFVIVGDGSERGALEWLSRKLLLHDCVRFVGDQPDIEPWYRNIHLVLLPHTQESNTQFFITSALAARIPVLCTDIAESREMQGQFENIFLVPPGASEKLSEKILSIYHEYESAFTRAMHVQEHILHDRSPEQLQTPFLRIL